MKSIFSELPNDIIIQIIRIDNYRKKYDKVIEQINTAGPRGRWWLGRRKWRETERWADIERHVDCVLRELGFLEI